jgi:hypothetical protein
MRDDAEYRRAGTGHLGLGIEPRPGWRPVQVTERRTTQDFAPCLQDLVDRQVPKAAVIRVVLDNRNT